MTQPSEFEIQRAAILWLKGTKTQPCAMLPGVICWHVPNGGNRGAQEGKRFKELGVLAGNPDVHLLKPPYGRLHTIEVKKIGGKLSDAQRELHPLLIASGALVAVVDNLNDFKWTCWTWGLVTNLSMKGVDSQQTSC